MDAQRLSETKERLAGILLDQARQDRVLASLTAAQINAVSEVLAPIVLVAERQVGVTYQESRTDELLD